MGYNSEFIDRFSLIREISRQMFVNGYLSQEDYVALPPSTFIDRRKRIFNYLQDDLLFDYSSGNKSKWITFSEARQKVNPFYRLFKTKKIMPADIAFHFSLLSLLGISQQEFTRDDLFIHYNSSLQYEDGNHADAWRISNIAINGVRIRNNKPIKALTKLIGEEKYKELRSLAIRKAQEKMGACVPLSRDNGIRLFVCGDVFKCWIGEREIGREQLKYLWKKNPRTIEYEELIREANKRARKRKLGKIGLGDAVVDAIMFDAGNIITVPEGKIIPLTECRQRCSEEQFDVLGMRIFQVCAPYCKTDIEQTVGNDKISLSIRKALANAHHIPQSKKQNTSFNISLEKYLQMGLLTQRKEAGGYLYAFSKARPFDEGNQGLFDRFPGLKDAVTFFSEESPLGLVGNQIMDLCYAENDLFSFRDRFVSQALDSIVLYELLEAIRNHQVIWIYAEKTDQYIQPKRLLQPIAVVCDMQLGRQFLLGWDPVKEGHIYYRVDLIRRILPDGASSWNESACKEGLAKHKNVWSSRIWNGTLHTIDVFLNYDAEKEKYIRMKADRERRNARLEEPCDGQLHLRAEVYDPLELMPWLLSFTGRVAGIVSPASKAEWRFREHISGMYQCYFDASGPGTRAYIPQGREYKIAQEEQPVSPKGKRLTVIPATSSPIYLNIVNSYIVCYDHILREMQDQPYSEEEVRELIEENVKRYAYRNTAVENKYITLESMLADRLLLRDEDGQYLSSFGLLAYRPFTTCEQRWIRTIADDPKMQLFLSSQEDVNALKACTGAVEDRLYDGESFQTVGVCRDGDDYADGHYQANFRLLMKAIRNKRQLEIRYTAAASSRSRTVILWPLRLEFSKMRDKFSLYGMESSKRVWIIRLSTIDSIDEVDDHAARPADITWKACLKALTVPDEEVLDVIVSTEANALERFMLEFQVYRKESRYDAEKNQCRVKIWYVKADHAEMTAKLLRFGKSIEVLGPEFIRSAVKERVARQHEMLFQKN